MQFQWVSLAPHGQIRSCQQRRHSSSLLIRQRKMSSRWSPRPLNRELCNCKIRTRQRNRSEMKGGECPAKRLGDLVAMVKMWIVAPFQGTMIVWVGRSQGIGRWPSALGYARSTRWVEQASTSHSTRWGGPGHSTGTWRGGTQRGELAPHGVRDTRCGGGPERPAEHSPGLRPVGRWPGIGGRRIRCALKGRRTRRTVRTGKMCGKISWQRWSKCGMWRPFRPR
jgi:hypothetical protein